MRPAPAPTHTAPPPPPRALPLAPRVQACHCALLICAHVLHRTHNSDPRLAPQWVAHAVWRAAHSLLLILNGTLSMELGSLAPHVVLELACVLRLMADPDHVHSVCAQMLHYVPQLADALQREVPPASPLF